MSAGVPGGMVSEQFDRRIMFKGSFVSFCFTEELIPTFLVQDIALIRISINLFLFLVKR